MANSKKSNHFTCHLSCCLLSHVHAQAEALVSEQELHRGGAARVEKYGVQEPLLVPPIHLQIHPREVPIGVHVYQPVFSLRCVGYLRSILVRWGHGDLEVRQHVREVRHPGARYAELPCGDHLRGGGLGWVDGQAGGGEDDGLHGAPDGDGAGLLGECDVVDGLSR